MFRISSLRFFINRVKTIRLVSASMPVKRYSNLPPVVFYLHKAYLKNVSACFKLLNYFFSHLGLKDIYAEDNLISNTNFCGDIFRRKT